MIPRKPDANPMPWVSASEITDYEAVDVSPKEAFAILDQIENGLVRCLIVLVSATGLRVSEALGLRWSDVEWEKGKIQVRRGFVDGAIGDPKSKASRAPVEMHKTLAAVRGMEEANGIRARSGLPFRVQADERVAASARFHDLDGLCSPCRNQGEGHHRGLPAIRAPQFEAWALDVPRGERHRPGGDPEDAPVVERGNAPEVRSPD